MSPATLVYSSDAATLSARKGWDTFDRLVWWALTVQGRPVAFDDVVRLLPDGVHFPLVAETLRFFARTGRARRVGGCWSANAAATVKVAA